MDRKTYDELLIIIKDSFAQTDKAIEVGKALAAQRDETMRLLRNANSQVDDLIAINKKAISYLNDHCDFLKDRGLMMEYTLWLKAKEDNPA